MGLRQGPLSATIYSYENSLNDTFTNSVQPYLFQEKQLAHLEVNMGIEEQDSYNESIFEICTIRIDSLRIPQSDISKVCKREQEIWLQANLGKKRVPRPVRQEIKQNAIDELQDSGEYKPSSRFITLACNDNKKEIYVEGMNHSRIEDLLIKIFGELKPKTIDSDKMKEFFKSRIGFSHKSLMYYDSATLEGQDSSSSFKGVALDTNPEIIKAEEAGKTVTQVSMMIAQEEENLQLNLKQFEEGFKVSTVKTGSIKEITDRILFLKDCYDEIEGAVNE